jgi:hypothetical protein
MPYNSGLFQLKGVKPMNSYLPFLITVGIIVGTGMPAFADNNTLTPPAVPPILQPPAGNIVFLKGHAVGTQDYFCSPSGTGLAWTFFGPQATLFSTFPWFGQEARQQIITHFLSPNPFEANTPRVTWQSSFDTSKVWGNTLQSSTDPNFVAPGAIPWLLVQVVGAQRGPSGGGILIQATFVQRLNTSGGVAPSGACSPVGSMVLVPYTADYFFYRASRETNSGQQ